MSGTGKTTITEINIEVPMSPYEKTVTTEDGKAFQNNISKEDLKQLNDVLQANPDYFRAFIEASAIMPQRRNEYSGSNSPYFNFFFMKDQLQLWFGNRITLTMRDVFAFYRILKYARWIVGKSMDSTVDEINYGLLDLGSEMHEQKQQAK